MLYESMANNATVISLAGVSVTAAIAIGISSKETNAFVAPPLKNRSKVRNNISAHICKKSDHCPALAE